MMYIFEDCIVDPQLYTLSRNGQGRHLQPKAFAVLSYLLHYRERVVTHQELCEHLWPNQRMGDAALVSAIRMVRRVLGDTGRAQRCIQTLHGRGYRFVAEVTEQPATEVVEKVPQTPQPPTAPASTWRNSYSIPTYAGWISTPGSISNISQQYMPMRRLSFVGLPRLPWWS